MEVWRIDLKNIEVTKEGIPETWEKFGGRGLIARILLDEVDPTCYPLGPKNKLIFAPGLLTGFKVSSCDRLSVGGKSPLTGGIKESNAGGTTGLKMSLLGIKALIIEESPLTHDWYVIYLSKQSVRFDNANEFCGMGVYECATKLLDRYGGKVAMALIGPGGEMKLSSAGIQNLDKDNIPSRIAARGGLGALMGSKRIKAIIFDAGDGEKPPLLDGSAFMKAQKIYTKELMDHPQTKAFAEYGTNAMPSFTNALGAIPTRNFSSGQFEDVNKIDGNYMRDLLIKRGGKSNTTHACMSGCVIRCSNIYGDDNGETIVSPLEYETVGLMGSNLGISDLDIIARLNFEANDLGVDTIEIGGALGVAAEAGLFAFGDGEAALRLLDEIRRGTTLGRVIGNGAVVVGKVFGVERVPAVKGQSLAAYEPRAIKGIGVTYATSPMGADHTAGLTVRAKVDHLDPNIQVEVSRTAQINAAGYDNLGACLFSGYGFATAQQTIGDMLKARYGWQVGEDILRTLGRETIELEREFNRRAGFTPAHDRIPEWMTREPLPPHNSVFDVPDEELDQIFNR